MPVPRLQDHSHHSSRPFAPSTTSVSLSARRPHGVSHPHLARTASNLLQASHADRARHHFNASTGLYERLADFILHDGVEEAIRWRMAVGSIAIGGSGASNAKQKVEIDAETWPQFAAFARSCIESSGSFDKRQQASHGRRSIDPLPPINNRLSAKAGALQAAPKEPLLARLLLGASASQKSGMDPRYVLHLAGILCQDGQQKRALLLLKKHRDVLRQSRADMTRLAVKCLMTESEGVLMWMLQEGLVHPDDPMIRPGDSAGTRTKRKHSKGGSKKSSPLKMLFGVSGNRKSRHSRRNSRSTSISTSMRRNLLPSLFYIAMLTRQGESLLRAMLRAGANYNARWMGISVIHLAVEQGRLAIVRLLLEEGADAEAGVNLRTYQRLLRLLVGVSPTAGMTDQPAAAATAATAVASVIRPLDSAARHPPIAVLLLGNSGDKPATSSAAAIGHPAHLVCTDLDLTIRMAKFGIPIDVLDPHGRTPLHHAAARGSLEQLSVLVHFRPDLLNRTSRIHSWYTHQHQSINHLLACRTAAHEAAAGGHGSCLAFLMDRPGYRSLPDAFDRHPDALFHHCQRMRHSPRNADNSATLLSYDDGEIDELIRQVQLFDLDDQQKSVDGGDGHGRKKGAEESKSLTASGASRGSRFKIERIGSSIISWLTK